MHTNVLSGLLNVSGFSVLKKAFTPSTITIALNLEKNNAF